MRLTDYQKKVKNYHAELSTLFAPYVRPEDKGKYRPGLANVLSKHHSRMKELDSGAKPSIMLYGIYNAGKSTLLNAIMGKPAAAVGDVPTTDRITPYEWNGYKLFDTPGIGAPEEHEKISDEKLDECHVIVFVVSSFEVGQNYERMREIIRKGKKLLIVLNDKNGLVNDEEIHEIKDRILKSLAASGESEAVVNKYKVIAVNAKDAFEARVEGEERLELGSNIGELESEIMKEIRRVDGFRILHNALKSMIDDCDPEVKKLFSAAEEANEGELNAELRQISEDYWDFVTESREIVKQQCAGLANAMYGVFPKEPAGIADKDELQNSLAQVQERYQKMAVDVLQSELGRIHSRISSQISKTAAADIEPKRMEAMGAGASLPDLNADIGADVSAPRSHSSSKSSDSPKNAFDAMDDIANVLPASTVLIPAPTPIPILLPVLIKAVTAVLKAIFTESDSERENRQVRAEAAAYREAEERMERERARWRQEIREFCETQSEQFVMNLQLHLRKHVEAVLKPLVEAAQNEIGSKKEDGRLLNAIMEKYYALEGEITITLEELVA